MQKQICILTKSTKINAVSKAFFFSTAVSRSRAHNNQWKRRLGIALGGTSLAFLSVVSYAARQWRQEHLQEIPLASECGVFYLKKNKSFSTTNPNKLTNEHSIDKSPAGFNLAPMRELEELLQTVMRAGLMGHATSVKQELEFIRKWHLEHGFHGGLVLRELNEPLFQIEGGDEVDPVPPMRESELHQRECYYLYYQVHPNGRVQQQIFCRGTTLASDVWTGVQSCLPGFTDVYDEDIQCYIHRGFQRHADRLLQDVLPLLIPPDSSRGTVELCGHSLGGATAILVAAKLKKRGYNVTRVTTVGAPRVCTFKNVLHLSALLPPDTLRIEADTDLVCKLPPSRLGLPDLKRNFMKNPQNLFSCLIDFLFAPDDKTSYVGNQLIFETDQSPDHIARFIPFQIINTSNHKQFFKPLSWVDSFWLHSRLFESLAAMPTSHRIPSYTLHIQQLGDKLRRLQ